MLGALLYCSRYGNSYMRGGACCLVTHALARRVWLSSLAEDGRMKREEGAGGMPRS